MPHKACMRISSFFFHLYWHGCLWPWGFIRGWQWYCSNSYQDPMMSGAQPLPMSLQKATVLTLNCFMYTAAGYCLLIIVSIMQWLNSGAALLPVILWQAKTDTTWDVPSTLQCVLKVAILLLVIMEILKKKNQITVLGLSRLRVVGFFVVLFWESGVKNHTSHEELCICKCRLNVSLFISWSPSTSTLSWKSGSLHGELFFGLVGFQNISRSSVACSWPYGGQSPIPCWKKKIHLNLLCTSLCFLFCCDSLAGKR